MVEVVVVVRVVAADRVRHRLADVDELEVGVVLCVARAHGGEIQRDAAGGRIAGPQADAIDLLVLLEALELGVVERIGVAVLEVAGEADAEVLVDRDRQRRPHDEVAVAAVEHLAVEGELAAGPVGDDVEEPGRGVLAEQRALWPAQDLVAVDVVEEGGEEVGAPVVDTVDHGAHRRVEAQIRVRRAETADHELPGRSRDVHRHVGRVLAGLLKAGDASLAEEFLAQHGDRGRRFFERLCHLGGRDRDLLKFLRLACRWGLRDRRGRRQKGGCECHHPHWQRALSFAVCSSSRVISAGKPADFMSPSYCVARRARSLTPSASTLTTFQSPSRLFST